MVIWNAARGPPPARERAPRLRRGEDAAALRQGALGDLGPLGEVPREHVPDPERRGARRSGIKPMNCPGHMLLFGSTAAQLPRPAAALRRGGAAPPQRARGHAARPHCACATSPRTTRTSSAPRSRSRTRSTAASTTLRYLYEPVRARAARRALDPAREPARHATRSGTAPRARSRGARAARASSTTSTRATARSTGRRSTCT